MSNKKNERNQVPPLLVNIMLITVLVLFVANNAARLLVAGYEPSVVVDGMMATVIGLIAMQRKETGGGEE
ncbi:hypothetical protein SEA_REDWATTLEHOG_6 [Gordonia phage RedWattleHog]|uniref:Holin n=1 Tax=Gordonia phage Stormageddon TaxID=2656541 RepID=A0A649VSE1_9CAUD|nr:hypothetical protein KHQ86_gp006 [Gordonia phage Stormageddon]QGJ94869.1 hypothetical protein SEA_STORMAGEDDON_6 [Gordonia phage Stormageddon]QLF83510.1 hypothetical protein SEA_REDWATTLEHOG_6 [Gordonia phage RedWattleHog]